MSIYAPSLSSNGQYAKVATTETTTSATFTDLATPGPAVTVTIGASGTALIVITADLSNNTINDYAVMGFALSGANTVVATATQALYNKASAANNSLKMSYSVLLTGLTPGSTTFTAKYERLVGGTASFADREISVIPF